MKRLFKLMILIFIATSTLLLAQDKPLLSEAIKNSIDTQGIETAKKHFKGIYESKKDLYEVDMKGLSDLSSTYVKAGNYQAASAVMEIASPFMQDMMSSKMGNNSNDIVQKQKKIQKQTKENQEKIEESEKTENNKQIKNNLGESRSDLKRFTGLYGDPEEGNETRRLWVMESCDGYLVSGALWGDVAPWWMKSEGDKVFTYSDSFNDISMEFVTDENGKAMKMIHNLSSLKSPLERVGPLPDDWDPCYERPKQ
jgi:rubrerythrin